MKSDLRGSAAYREMAEVFGDLYRPGSGQFHALGEIAAQPGGTLYALAGEMFLAGGGAPVGRIGLADGPGGEMRLLSEGAHSDRAPAWSPDGRALAFLSDRDGARGVLRVLLARAGDLAAAEPLAPFEGETAETVSWSPDGKRLLVVTVGVGADAAGPSGMATHGEEAKDVPSWVPEVEPMTPENFWRRAWVVDVATGERRVVGPAGVTVWEAAWSGENAIVAIVSDNPREGGWYEPKLMRVPLDGPATELAPRSSEQLGGATGSPDGRWIAVIEGCFHHSIASGRVRLYDLANGGEPTCPPIPFEVTCVRWAGPGRLFAIGTAATVTVAAYLDLGTGVVTEAWRSDESCGRRVPVAWPTAGGFVCGLEAYDHPARVTLIGDDGTRTLVHALDHEGTRTAAARYGQGRVFRWRGRDGLEIDGFLATPPGPGPFPLIAFIHGGPVYAYRNMWAFEYPLVHVFVREGYAVFMPNPRGSLGRSQAFARRVMGDLGGEDSHDILTGVDQLVAEGVADPERLGVSGASYGGYMTSWLVTQTDRFAAACAISAMTDLRSQYFTAHHPEFLALYAGATPYEVGGAFDARSPVLQVRGVRTPVLNLTGAQDRTTPPGQALEFHRALIDAGATTELVTYPEEGHGARRFEAQVDQAARIMAWFRRFIPPAAGASSGRVAR